MKLHFLVSTIMYQWYGGGSNGTGVLGMHHTNDVPYLLPIPLLDLPNNHNNNICSNHSVLEVQHQTTATWNSTDRISLSVSVPTPINNDTNNNTISELQSSINKIWTSGRHTWFGMYCRIYIHLTLFYWTISFFFNFFVLFYSFLFWYIENHRKEIFVCGCNTYGQCGISTTASNTANSSTLSDSDNTTNTNLIIVPQFSSMISKISVQFISCGWDHTAILTTYGQVYTFGCSLDGRLGLSDIMDTQTTKLSVPTLVHFSIDDHNQTSDHTNTTIIQSIACGEKHSLAVDTNGNVYGWGTNRHGLLPTSNSTVTNTSSSILTRNNNYSPIPVYLDMVTTVSKTHNYTENDSIDKVYAGWQHSIAVTKAGYIITWGNNRYYQCGRESIVPSSSSTTTSKSSTQNILLPGIVYDTSNHTPLICQQLATGWYHTIIINSLYQVYTWGRSDLGQLGIGIETNTDRSKSSLPCSISLSCYFVDKDKQHDTSSIISPPISISNIACGSESTYISLSCGCIYSCGWNEHSNLSIDTKSTTIITENIFIPTLMYIPNYSLAQLHEYYQRHPLEERPKFVCAGATTFLRLPIFNMK